MGLHVMCNPYLYVNVVHNHRWTMRPTYVTDLCDRKARSMRPIYATDLTQTAKKLLINIGYEQ